MKLLERLKNVFTNHLVEKEKIIEMVKEKPVFSFSIDLDELGTVVSVERLVENEDSFECSCIGYWPKDKNVIEPLEWYLFLNHDQHEELVNQFNKHIGKDQ